MSTRWTIESHDIVTSTMDLARERVRAGAGDGLVVVASEQSTGRGRRGHRWDSPRGGLWFSVVIGPEGTSRPTLMPELTVAAALAAAAACTVVTGLDVRVKWPNDLYVDGAEAGAGAKPGGAAKLGGVIAETESGSVVLGVGVNVNVSAEMLPSAEFYRTTSLQHETGTPVDINDLLERILSELGRRVELVRDGGLAGLLPEWRERSIELERLVSVERAGETIRGVVRDIGADGSLHVETESRIVEVAPHGEVTVVVEAPNGRGAR